MRVVVMLASALILVGCRDDQATGSVNTSCAERLYSPYNPKNFDQCVTVCNRCERNHRHLYNLLSAEGRSIGRREHTPPAKLVQFTERVLERVLLLASRGERVRYYPPFENALVVRRSPERCIFISLA